MKADFECYPTVYAISTIQQCSLHRQAGKTQLGKLSQFLGTSKTTKDEEGAFVRASEHYKAAFQGILGMASGPQRLRIIPDWLFLIKELRQTQSTREEEVANETQLSDISLTSGPVPTPALVDPHHLSLSKGRETQWACIVSLPHDITQGHAGPLTAFSQSLPV